MRNEFARSLEASEKTIDWVAEGRNEGKLSLKLVWNGVWCDHKRRLSGLRQQFVSAIGMHNKNHSSNTFILYVKFYLDLFFV